MEINDAVRVIRKKRGLSQKELGELCVPKIDGKNIRRIESEKSNPTINTVKKLSRALGVNLFRLLDADLKEE